MPAGKTSKLDNQRISPEGIVASRRSRRALFFKAVIPIVVLGVASAAFWALASTKPQTRPRAVLEKAFTVDIVKVEIGAQQPTLKLYGETIAGRKIDLRALVAGEVIETAPAFREGGIVKKGEIILKIDPFEFRAAVNEAQADLNEAVAKRDEISARIGLEGDQIKSAKRELALAERDLERARDLFTQKLIAQKGVDDRAYTVSQRSQNVRQRQSNLAIERARLSQQEAAIARLQSKLLRAKRDLRNTTIRAPFNAYVSAIAGEQGRRVGVNDTIATLIDADRIDARFNFSDAQYGRMVANNAAIVGRPAKITWQVGNTRLEYNATIERVAAQITAASGGVEIYARIDHKNESVRLRPGAFVEVELDDRRVADVARLPESALYDNKNVYVVNASMRLEVRPVEIIGYAENDVLVRGALKNGDRVITTRLSRAGTGLLVQTE